jgi:hypothetical protein
MKKTKTKSLYQRFTTNCPLNLREIPQNRLFVKFSEPNGVIKFFELGHVEDPKDNKFLSE